MFGAYCILLECLLFTRVISLDYCEYCDGTHTMCLYKEPSSNCRNYNLTSIKVRERNKILDAHNTLRSSVASGKAQGKNKQFLPTATDMREIKWDEELESIAEQWALQCVPYEEPHQHDKCRFVERFDVGQNIHTIFSVDPPITSYENMIFQWYKEILNFSYTDFTNEQKTKQSDQNNEPFLHFTQMMYSRLEFIGCAEIVFTAKVQMENVSNMKLGYIKRFICNYGPMYETDELLYSVGTACSDCPVGWLCNPNTGLCTDRTISKMQEKQGSIIFKQVSSEASRIRIDVFISMLLTILLLF